MSSKIKCILVDDWGVGCPILVNYRHHESDEFWPEVQVLYWWTLLLSGKVLLPALWRKKNVLWDHLLCMHCFLNLSYFYQPHCKHITNTPTVPTSVHSYIFTLWSWLNIAVSNDPRPTTHLPARLLVLLVCVLLLAPGALLTKPYILQHGCVWLKLKQTHSSFAVFLRAEWHKEVASMLYCCHQ